MTDIADVSPQFSNMVGLAVGPGVVRLTFGETLNNVTNWHVAIYLPVGVAKTLSELLGQTIGVEKVGPTHPVDPTEH